MTGDFLTPESDTMRDDRDSDKPLSAGKAAALGRLARAHDDADDLNVDILQFALSLADLYQGGASESDLRWLVKRNYVIVLVEMTGEHATNREFRAHSALTFSERTCFVLSYAGKLFVRSRRLNNGHSSALSPGPPGQLPALDRVFWDAECHELWVDGQLVKRYKHAASNQWVILSAFQESNWQHHVTLVPASENGRTRPRRLSEMVWELNESLKDAAGHSPLHFRMDGTGHGVFCELEEE